LLAFLKVKGCARPDPLECIQPRVLATIKETIAAFDRPTTKGLFIPSQLAPDFSFVVALLTHAWVKELSKIPRARATQ
jgi:hypothetical protein